MWKLWLVLVAALLEIGSSSAAPWSVHSGALSNRRHLLMTCSASQAPCASGTLPPAWGGIANFFDKCFTRTCISGGKVTVTIKPPGGICDYSNVVIYDTSGTGTCLARQDGPGPLTVDISCSSSYQILVKKGGGSPFQCTFSSALVKSTRPPGFPVIAARRRYSTTAAILGINGVT